MTGTLAYGDVRCRVEFHYGVIRLWQQPVEDYLRAGVAILPLATLCRMPSGPPLPEALRDVVQEIHHRLNQEASHADAVKLMTAAYILSGLRVDKSDLATIYRGVGLMSESTAFDEAIEEGLLRGEIKRSHHMLLLMGSQQFGVPDAETETSLKSIRDLDRLERMAIAILTTKSWQELLATA